MPHAYATAVARLSQMTVTSIGAHWPLSGLESAALAAVILERPGGVLRNHERVGDGAERDGRHARARHAQAWSDDTRADSRGAEHSSNGKHAGDRQWEQCNE